MWFRIKVIMNPEKFKDILVDPKENCPTVTAKPVIQDSSRIFQYRDKFIGDRDFIELSVYPTVFYPTSTTGILLRSLRISLKTLPKTLLDLGCGCGIVSVVAGKVVAPEARIFASDLSESAVLNAKQNAQDHGITLDCRQGSLFEPWDKMKFDLIFCDVPGIAEPIARKTNWYPSGIPCDSGYDGTLGTLSVLNQAHRFLSPEGFLLFGVASLSRTELIASGARRKFQSVEILDEKWFPFSEELINALDDLKDMADKEIIIIEKKRSRWFWRLQVYCVSKPTENC